MPQSSRGRARLLLLALQLASAVAFVSPLSRESGFPLDDAWIHQVVARTLATTGTLGYYPGAHGTGATSYFWAALLAFGHLLHLPPVGYTDVLGVLCALVTGQGLLDLAWPRTKADVGVERAPEAVVAVAIACAGGELTWYAFSGMEASLVCALLVMAMQPARLRVLPLRRRALGAGTLAAYAALTRPDLIPFGLLVALYLVKDVERERRREALLWTLAPWAAGCLLYFGSNALFAGTLLPATMKGRRWLWIESAGGNTGLLASAKELLFAWAYRLRQFTLGVSSNEAFWVALGLAVLGVRDALRKRTLALVWLAGFAVLHLAVYVAILPTPGHGGRYQPLVPVLFVYFVATGSFALVRALVGKRGTPARVLSVVFAVALVAVFGNAWWEWRLANAAAIAHVNATEKKAGEAVAALPADARVASFDVGAIGYFSRRPLLDLGALTTPFVLPALVHEEVADLLVKEHVTHLVLPAGVDVDQPDLSNFGFRLRVVDHPGLRLEPLATFESDRATWLRGVWYTQNATFRQRLYAVTKSECPTIRPPVSPPGAWSVDGIPKADRARVTAAYAKAAANGLCVRVGKTPPEPSVGCWSVSLDDIPRLGAAPPATVRARDDAAIALRLHAGPHLARGDVANAAVAVLHALASVVRADLDPCFFTALPAIERALPPGTDLPREPKDTWTWGLPVSALVVVVGLFREVRRARRRPRKAERAKAAKASEKENAEAEPTS